MGALNLKDFDVFFLSYDEPSANLLWHKVRERIPWAKRVHGVKGFDAAYKTCAKQSSTSRFFTIDGDNELLPLIENIEIPTNLLEEEGVLSWGAKNSVNGLCYGNGGVKNWRVDIALKMMSHEQDSSGQNVDFCFQVPYIQMPEILSIARIHDSPYQAFRAGYREGIKLSLVKGKKQRPSKLLKDFLWWENLDRLKIWCSVGLDRDCGEWAILGARMGVSNLFFEDLETGKIADYDWFQQFWIRSVWPKYEDADGAWNRSLVVEEIQSMGSRLQNELGLDICLMNKNESAFFRSVYINPHRQGRLIL